MSFLGDDEVEIDTLKVREDKGYYTVNECKSIFLGCESTYYFFTWMIGSLLATQSCRTLDRGHSSSAVNADARCFSAKAPGDAHSFLFARLTRLRYTHVIYSPEPYISCPLFGLQHLFLDGDTLLIFPVGASEAIFSPSHSSCK